MKMLWLSLGFLAWSGAAVADAWQENPDCVFFDAPGLQGSYWTAQAHGKDPSSAHLTAWWQNRAQSVWVKQGFVFYGRSQQNWRGQLLTLGDGSITGQPSGGGTEFDLNQLGFGNKLESYACMASSNSAGAQPDAYPWQSDPDCIFFEKANLQGAFATSQAHGKDPSMAYLPTWWRNRANSVWVKQGFVFYGRSQPNWQGQLITLGDGTITGQPTGNGSDFELGPLGFANTLQSYACMNNPNPNPNPGPNSGPNNPNSGPGTLNPPPAPQPTTIVPSPPPGVPTIYATSAQPLVAPEDHELHMGTDWFKLGLTYDVNGYTSGSSYAMANMYATIAKSTSTLISGSFQTTRVYGSSGKIADDQLSYSADGYVLGQKANITSGTLAVNYKYTGTAPVQYQSTFFENTWYPVMVGPVPVAVTLGLTGSFSAGQPFVSLSLGANDVTTLDYSGGASATASLIGYGRASLSPNAQLEDNIEIFDVSAEVDVTLVQGTITAAVSGNTNSAGPCAKITRSNMTTLGGHADLHATSAYFTWYNEATGAATQICDLFGLNCKWVDPIPDWVKKYRDKATDVYPLLNWSGTTYAPDDVWWSAGSCQTAAPATTLHLCNNHPADISVAYASFDSSSGTWQGHGWFNVTASTCFDVQIGDNPADHVYLYAKASDGTEFGSSDQTMCVDRTQPFSWAIDQSSCSGSYQVVRTFLMNVAPGQPTTQTFN